MKRILWVGMLLAMVGAGGFAFHSYHNYRGRLTTPSEYTGLARSVEANTLISLEAHPIDLTFGPEFEYVGGQKFVLYEVADVEQHMFVATHPDGSTKTLICVQYETLLPEIQGGYDYSGAEYQLELDGVTFNADARPVRRHPISPSGWPGTDGYRFRSFMAKRGYKLPLHRVWSRLAYVPESDPRQEMLIVYVDDLAPTGFTSEQLREEGGFADQWPEIARAHFAKIKTDVTVEPRP